MKNRFLIFSIAGLLCIQASQPLHAQRVMEYLDRAVLAVPQTDGKAFVSWRLSASDPGDISFNLYRSSGNANPVKLNNKPIMLTTGYQDAKLDSNVSYTYFVKAVLKGKESAASRSFILPAHPKRYLSVPLQTPPGYTPNDASVADLDGDGQYEIVLHQAGRGRDNASAGFTDPPVFQAYTLEGKLLWTINLGKNVREGAHYTQFMLYDIDGDGKAELAMKTADGTIDGKGKVIGDSSKNWLNKDGKILDGPEFFTIFDGLTGAALATTDYIPSRGLVNGWGGRGGNGGNDNSGNRVDRFTACVAYLDGKLPSVVMCRGYYGRTVLAAWDWRNHKLTSRWVFDTKDSSSPYSGMGNHNLSVADVDQDGKDEIIFGSMCVDDNGKGLYTTGLRHGDAIHVSDLDPAHPGLEVFGVHEIEERTQGAGSALYEAGTGKILWTGDMNKDVGRGVAADIDPRYPGAETWEGSEGMRSIKGEHIGDGPRSVNFIISWDDDQLSELLNGTVIEKWDYLQGKLVKLFDAKDYNCVSNNGTKANPVLSADILGDWREEVIYRTADNQELRIFSTDIPSKYKYYTFMHDPQYRLSICWQNVGYNQPPHTGFFLGYGMKAPPKPAVVLSKQK